MGKEAGKEEELGGVGAVDARGATLGLVRGVWVTGMLVQAGAIGVRVWAWRTPPSRPVMGSPEMFAAQLGVAGLVGLLCMYLRGQAYKANWVKDVITPRGYLEAHVSMAGVMGAVTLVGLVSMAMGWQVDGGLAGNVVFLSFMWSAWPDGKPMGGR